MMMYTLNKIRFFFAFCVTVLSVCSYGQSDVFKVTLDAGHGAHDFGAAYTGFVEKKISLAIMLKVGEILETHKDIKVNYTRKTDVFVGLIERADVANDAKANVFVSIHCNASSNRSADGTEAYVMGMSKITSNLEAAKKENGAVIYENDYKKKYVGFDHNHPETMIGLQLLQEVYLLNSISLAGRIMDEFGKIGRKLRGEKGVKQAPYMVLHKAYMTRVLVETGFISNPTEGAYLNSELGQNQLARGIANAILSYKNEFFGSATEESQSIAKTLPSDSSIPAHSKEVLASTNTQTLPKKKSDSLVIENPVLITTIPTEASKTVVIESTAIPKPIPTSGNNANSKIEYSNFISKIQFFASSKKHDLNSSKFNGFEGVTEEIDGSLFKYSCGLNTNLDNLKESYNTLNYVRRQGFPSAFLVVYKDGKRLSDNEIDEIMYPQLMLDGKKSILRNKNTENDVIESYNNHNESLKTDYYVQLMATKTYIDKLEINSKGLKDIEVSFENGYYKYFYGLTSDYNTSVVYLEEAKSKGYPGAFLIAFKGGRKLSLDELKRLSIQEANK